MPHPETAQSNSVVGQGHQLQTTWAFWYDVKLTGAQYADAKRQNPDFHYRDNLKKLGAFDTVEGFWAHYVHLKRPSTLGNDVNLYMFRENEMPLWENYPAGGCWILKVRKGQGVLGKLWQDLLFGIIGEMFEEPSVIGVTVATRTKVDMISVWNKDNRNPQIRFNIGEKLKRILSLDARTVIEYKFHQRSLADKSTYCNADAFVFADKNRQGVDGTAGDDHDSKRSNRSRAESRGSFRSDADAKFGKSNVSFGGNRGGYKKGNDKQTGRGSFGFGNAPKYGGAFSSNKNRARTSSNR